MAARSNVPKFGNWENEDNVPYTVYFEKARKNRGGGKMTNPNDPNEVFPDHAAPPRGSKHDDEPIGRGAVKPVQQHEQRGGEGGDYRQPNKSPARGENMGGQRNALNYGQRAGGGRPGRASGGSEHSVDRSPLHPHYQAAKLAGAGSASPGWDGKSYDNSRGGGGDHGRTRQRPPPPRGGDESPDGAAVPKFGEWDENDPSSAEQFTGIFEKVREERNAGTGNISGTPRHSTTNNRASSHGNHQPKCCSIL